MNFTPLPPSIEEPKDQPGVMHIEGPTSNRVRWYIRWFLLLAIVAGLLIGLFIKFGATIAWSFCLVAFMFAYMLMMGRWASSHRH